MTDQERDELLSAVVDGTASVDDAERVAGDPGLAARLASMRGTREVLGASIVAPAGLVDGQIAAALDVFDELHGVDEAPLAPVTTLASRRPLLFRPAVAAAAVVAVLALGGIVLATQGSDDTMTASPHADTSDDADSTESNIAADDGEGGPTAAELAPDSDDSRIDATSTTDPQAVGDTPTGSSGGGGFEQQYFYGSPVTAATIDELVAQVRTALAEGGPDADRAPAPTPDCDGYVEVRDSFTSLRYEATGSLDGRDVRIVVGDTDNGTELYVFGSDTCDLVHNERL